MADFARQWAQATWNLTVEASPWLLGGFVLAGVIFVLFPLSAITRHLGGTGVGGVVKASLVGVPLPLCSCSVIPVASSLRRRGASRGAFAGFLISTPETGVDSVAVSYALLGPVFAIIRPVAAFATALVAGSLINVTGEHLAERHQGNGVDEADADACATGCGCEEPVAPAGGLLARIKSMLRYGLIDMVADLSPWLAAGFLLAGLATAVIPEGFLQDYVGSGWLAMGVMLCVGLPLYVCSTSSTPIAAALIAQGLSPGAALVFLLVGPATNIATMVVVLRDLGGRGLAIYLAAIAAVAMIFGFALDRLYLSIPPALAAMPGCNDVCATPGMWPIAVIMIALTLNGLRVRFRPGGRN